MSVLDQLSDLDTLVSKGLIVDAVQKYFSEDAQTRDFDGTITKNKSQMLEKMNAFVGAIQEVNGITLHQSVSDQDLSFSEFTFDFAMKDGSHILWHEIIRRLWRDGKVIREQYFKN